MGYYTTQNPDVVLCADDGVWVSRGTRQWDKYEEWVAEGNTATPYVPYEVHSPQHYAAIRERAWAWMTEHVVARRYDSIESCVGYYNSGVERYQREARAMVAWRDAVNQALEALVTNPPPNIETWEQVRPLLPQPEEYDWPQAEALPLDTVPTVQLPLE